MSRLNFLKNEYPGNVLGKRRSVRRIADDNTGGSTVFHYVDASPFGGHADIREKDFFRYYYSDHDGSPVVQGDRGASPFLPTVVATAAMVAINRFLSWLASINGKIDLLVKGSPLILFDDGVINWRNMKKANLSYSDLIESLRIETLKESLADIEKAYLETNGQISFVEKNKN